MSAPDVVDLFAGPGGWSTAASALGMVEVGVENDTAAVATRKACGFRTMASDITKVSPYLFSDVKGVIASPPCPTFSTAGKGSGRRELDLILQCIERMAGGEWPTDLIAKSEDPRTMLTLQPLRWVLLIRPAWFAFEQVPAVLPVWQAMCAVLDQHGYSTASGYVYSEQHGVPQTRKRAVAVGRRDGKVARLPVPTHSRYHSRSPERLDPGVQKWVSMAEALGQSARMVGWRGAGMVERHGERPDRGPGEPAFTVTGGGGTRYRWEYRSTTMPNSARRPLGAPAPTIAFGHDAASAKWVPEVNNQSGTEYDLDEQLSAPASVVAGRDIVTFRGANANRFNGSTKSRNDGVRVTVEEAAALQTFTPGHPFMGTKSKRYQQVGNAVPPLMALAILREIAF